MSLPAQNPYPQQVAAAGATVFAFAWRCDNSNLVVVYVNDAQDGGFTVQLNADQVAAPGGTITRAVPCAGGDIVTIERVNPQTQNFNITAYNPFTAVALTLALDRILEMVQEVWAKLARGFYVKRSVQSKIASFELPAPVDGQVIGWRSNDGGATHYLDNLGNVLVGATLPGTMVKNEVPGGAVNGTTGSDGNAAFALAHTPISTVLMDIYVDGVRQPPARYGRVNNIVTFLAPYIPITGSTIYADYFY